MSRGWWELSGAAGDGRPAAVASTSVKTSHRFIRTNSMVMTFFEISLRWRPNIFVNLQSHTTTWQSGCSRTVISPCSWQPRLAIFSLFWQYFCQKSCSAWENCPHDKYKISPLVHSIKSDDETTNCYQCKNSTYFSSKSCTWRVDKTFCRFGTYWRRILNILVKSCNKT